MNRKTRAHFVEETLNRLFPNPQIPLNHQDPFTLLVAVLLSAQCTDERVNKTTETLFARADTPEKMAEMPVEEIQKLIYSCGLASTKARALKSLSKQIIQRFDSAVPHTFSELESLPGVGHKTASVVLIQAFGIPAFPVDTHIFRVAKRWGLARGKHVREVEEELKSLFPKKRWAHLHLQMILYARKFCPARNHSLSACPICSKLGT